MRFIKKTASIISSLIIILAIGGFVFVRNFDLNKYKPYIQNEVMKLTGRNLQINGDASLGISLIPTVVINDVTFSNPNWAKNPDMLKLEKLEVKFAIMPLLKKKIEVSKLIIKKPEIYLETAKDGENNWSFGNKEVGTSKKVSQNVQPKIKDASAALGIGLIAEGVEFDDGIVNYYDARTMKTVNFNINEINMEVPADNKPITIDVDATYDRNNIKLDAEISTLNSLLEEGKVDFVANLNALKIKADLRGAVEDILDYPRYAVELNIHNPSGNLGIPEISTEMRLDGDISSVDAIIKSLNIAANQLTGTASVNWPGNKPMVKANLSTTKFDVNSLAKTSLLSFKIPSLISEAKALTMVPQDKIPYEYLKYVDGVFDLRAGQIILANNFTINDVIVNAKLQNGILDVSGFDFNVGGGKVNSKLYVNALDKRIKLDLVSNNLKLEDVVNLNSSGVLQVLAGGRLDIDTSLTSFGETYRKLSENISGQFVAVMDKSEIKTTKMDWLTKGILGQLMSILNVDSSSVSKLDILCAVVRSDIKNGKAEFPSGVVFNSEQLKVVGNGNVDLVDDKIDFTIAPMMNKLSKGNITQALASFIRIGGRLQDPKLELDKTSALTTIVGSVATGGIYLGTEILLNGDDDPCYSALQGTKFANKFKASKGVKATTKNIYKDVTNQTKDAVKGLGNAAKDLFNAFTGN